ncbi:hypothetical protein SAMN02982927_01955 [Sporolactobacillus nakayamae]|uniref:Uncharacterized protein n=1 Tax=Sporolactobacillus nakayamae TaxID=269670 RepID=A0A1I2SLU9_9BACL|nr:hypothetical protein SAMN02982927_01955 [Sporolactobacillus nakayamae]
MHFIDESRIDETLILTLLEINHLQSQTQKVCPHFVLKHLKSD